MKNQPVEPEVVKEVPTEALARYEAPPSTLALSAVFDLDTAKKRLFELQEFVQFYMKEGEDFGIIPGTPKPTLYKSGADKLCDIYGIADQYKITNRTEDWSKNLFDYEVECTLTNKRDGSLVATGLGSCNSFEGKYRWRELKRKCPECGKETIIKGKQEWGGGWVCWNKPGKSDGCGFKFEDGDKQIESQEVGKVENEDIPTLKNTLLKMAKKRAKIDAVLSATRSSGLFTQDIEDWDRPEEPRGTKEAAQKVAERKIAEYRQRQSKNASPEPRNRGIMDECRQSQGNAPNANRNSSQDERIKDFVASDAHRSDGANGPESREANTRGGEFQQGQSEQLESLKSASTYSTRDTMSLGPSAHHAHATSSHSVADASRSASKSRQDTGKRTDRYLSPRDTTQASTTISQRSLMEERSSTPRNSNEIITLTPRDGLLAISGPGLNIIRSEMTDDDRKFFGIKFLNGFFCFEERLVFKFQDLCTRLKVPYIMADQGLPKANIPPADWISNEKGELKQEIGSDDPILEEAKELKPKGKTPFMLVKWNGGEHSSFDKAIWPMLAAAVGKPVILEVKANGKYSNVVRILRVDGVNFADEQNQQSEPQDDWIPF